MANPNDSLETQAPLVGAEPVPNVHLFENHDRAYEIWRESGLKESLLIHIDAHHDMWWIDPDGHRTIANFICSALAEDIVREVWWIVPDQTWESRECRRPLLRHLERIIRKYPRSSDRIEVKPDRISVRVLDKNIRILPLNKMPAPEGEVLLDVDTDFLVIPRVTYGEFDTHSPLPWCWPDQLISRLVERKVRTRWVTIAYSVEGGYTPLKWKYLGDELKTRIETPSLQGSILEGMTQLRRGADAAFQGDLAGAEEGFLAAARSMPESPAPLLHLAYLYLEKGRGDQARESYQRALSLDPTYRTAYSNLGMMRYYQRLHREARAEFERTLLLNPRDPYAHLGMARLAARQGDWASAELSLNKAAEADRDLVDVQRDRGEVLARLGKIPEAISAYETSLKLVLAGRTSLDGSVMTCADESRLSDPGHGRIHAELARLYERQGKRREAIDGYRMGIAGDYDGTNIRLRLARLYAQEHQWKRALLESWRAMAATPRSLAQAWKERSGR
jgi:Flp pilus assembly protein TadD